MHGSFKILSIRRINFYLHWTFLFLISWVLLVNAQNGNDPVGMGWSLLFILGFFISVVIHELGHAVTAMEYGIEAKNIVLLPFGGVASIEKFPDNPRQELLISLSGPLTNLIIAGILKILFPYQTVIPDEYSELSIAHAHDFILNLYLANIVLAVFNLIPAFPLDGGRILRALIAFRTNYLRATSIASLIGKIIAAGMIGAGILFYNPLLPIAGLFIIFGEDTEEDYLRIRSLVKNIKLKDVTMFDYSSLQQHITVLEAGEILMHNHSRYFVLLDDDTPTGTIDRTKILSALAEKKSDTLIADLEKGHKDLLDGEQQADQLLEKLAVQEERIFPVMQNGYFAGVVSLQHIIEYLLLQKAHTEDYKRVKSLSLLLH